jgi:hypothetical protein
MRDNPHYSIRSGRTHREIPHGHRRENEACRNPICRPYRTKQPLHPRLWTTPEVRPEHRQPENIFATNRTRGGGIDAPVAVPTAINLYPSCLISSTHSAPVEGFWGWGGKARQGTINPRGRGLAARRLGKDLSCLPLLPRILRAWSHEHLPTR